MAETSCFEFVAEDAPLWTWKDTTGQLSKHVQYYRGYNRSQTFRWVQYPNVTLSHVQSYQIRMTDIKISPSPVMIDTVSLRCMCFLKCVQTRCVVVDLISHLSAGAPGSDPTVTDCWRSSPLLPVPGMVLKCDSSSSASLLARGERLAPFNASAWQQPMLTKWLIPVCQLSSSAKMALSRGLMPAVCHLPSNC